MSRDPVNGSWRLTVANGSAAHEFTSDFLVLCVDGGAACCSWQPTSGKLIPRYALRACVDTSIMEYLFVGRPVEEPDDSPQPAPRYLTEGWRWHDYSAGLPAVFGKVHRTHGCMYAPVNGLELAFNRYETLCLKPSPATLKDICRILLRQMAGYSNR